MRISVSSRLALLAVLLFPALAGAQTVRGELVERGSGQPIRAAMVLLLDSAGARRVATLTDSAGRFELRAPAAGTYRLRAERVGFRSTVSPPLALGEGQVRAYRLEGDPVAVSLAEVRVRGARRCRVRPGAGQGTAVLWEEARKALSAAAHTDQAGLLRFDVELYGRDLEPGTRRVLKDEREQRSGQAHAPFRAASVDSLSRFGFVRSEGDSLVFHAPDAGVLLSDRFLADHCFRVQEDDEHAGMLGLAFEPVPARRDVAEVTGVLWLDRRTAELRWLEYSYVHLAEHLEGAGAGGRVEFARLPAGYWIVNKWHIRMPVFRVPENRVSRVGGLAAGGTQRPQLAWIREGGGEVVSSSVRDARTPARAGRIAGVAWDSLNARPLAGARVFVSGTGWAGVADSAGRFAMDGVAEGRYTVSFEHPVLVEWSTVPGAASVQVTAGAESGVAVGTPSLQTLIDRRCASTGAERLPGVVMGFVFRDTQVQPGAVLRFSWRTLGPSNRTLRTSSAMAQADRTGFYTVCDVPTNVQLDIAVEAAGARHRDRLVLQNGTFERYDIEMPGSDR